MAEWSWYQAGIQRVRGSNPSTTINFLTTVCLKSKISNLWVRLMNNNYKCTSRAWKIFLLFPVLSLPVKLQHPRSPQIVLFAPHHVKRCFIPKLSVFQCSYFLFQLCRNNYSMSSIYVYFHLKGYKSKLVLYMYFQFCLYSTPTWFITNPFHVHKIFPNR